jgi:hypothetical protein
MVQTRREYSLLFVHKVSNTQRAIWILGINLGLYVPEDLMRRIGAFYKVKYFLECGYPHPGIYQLQR